MQLWTGMLVLAVIFVNGWTDAPNAIATAVGTGALPFRRAALLAAVCNVLGTAATSLLCPWVAATIEELAAFPEAAAGGALQASLLTIVLWAVLAWRFGIPTSESHAMLAALSGATLAMGQKLDGIRMAAWGKTLAGLALSIPAGMLAAVLFRRLTQSRIQDPMRWQVLSAGVMAFLHGAQDGQKFLALLLLCAPHCGRLPLILLTAAVMGAGTACGGKPIVEKVGSDLARLSPAEGLSADLRAGLVLLACSLLGLPVSTTHARVAAVRGAGRISNAPVLGEMAGAWLLTFPCCAVLAWAFTRLMLF